MKAVLAVFAGAVTGMLSAWGVGGGTLLVVFMTTIAGIRQENAQGINLLYFIPTSISALYWHIKNKLPDMSAVLPAIICGVPVTLITAFFATSIDTSVLKRIFGLFLIITGLCQLRVRKQ